MPQGVYNVKRCHPRFSVSAEADAILRDGTSIPAQVLELSAQGCYIDAIEPVSVGSELSLHIVNGQNSCELPGRVIYLHPGLGFAICGMGVVFGTMGAEERSKIDAWLVELAATQILKTVS